MVARQREGFVSVVMPCPTCQLDMSGGNEYDEARVNNAIDRYIDDWFSGRIDDPVLTRRIGADKERKEREATYTTRRTWKHG